MKEYRLLIVDADPEYTGKLTDCLSRLPAFRIVGVAASGLPAQNLLHTTKPDVVLLDPLLPEVDGLFLMKSMKTMKHKPVVICVSQFYTSISVELARRNGASYYVYKPIEPKALASVIVECADMAAEKSRLHRDSEEVARNSDLMRSIYGIMRELGFSTKFSGSEYIAQSVAMAVESPMILHNLVNGLYKQLAERMNTSASCIERSMRTAISAANANGSLEAMIGAAPTNKICIRYILRMLNLQL